MKANLSVGSLSQVQHMMLFDERLELSNYV